MPFIVTTLVPLVPPEAGHDVSRRAVATLEEAQRVCIHAHPKEAVSFMLTAATADQVVGLTEIGGTVGPLPDGTVIEVYSVEHAVTLAGEIGWSAERALSTSDAEIIAAYNAKQATA